MENEFYTDVLKSLCRVPLGPFTMTMCPFRVMLICPFRVMLIYVGMLTV